MGYRTILSAQKMLNVKNTTGYALSLSGASIAPGKNKDVPAWIFSQDKFRSEELATLISRGSASVTLNGYPLTADAVRGLESPLATPLVVAPSMPTASLPAPASVPIGHVVFDTTLGALVTNDGAAWV